MDPITLGANSIIDATAVVVQDITDNSIAGSIYDNVIRQNFSPLHELEQDKDETLREN